MTDSELTKNIKRSINVFFADQISDTVAKKFFLGQSYKPPSDIGWIAIRCSPIDIRKNKTSRFISFRLNLLCCVPINDNIYDIDVVLGKVTEAMLLSIPILDDLTQCLVLKDSLRISNFGSIAPDVPLNQATAEATYSATVDL